MLRCFFNYLMYFFGFIIELGYSGSISSNSGIKVGYIFISDYFRWNLIVFEYRIVWGDKLIFELFV